MSWLPQRDLITMLGWRLFSCNKELQSREHNSDAIKKVEVFWLRLCVFMIAPEITRIHLMIKLQRFVIHFTSPQYASVMDGPLMCALFLNLLAMLSISRLHQKLPRLSKDTAIGYKTSQVRSQSRCLQLHVFIHYDSNLCTFADVWVINYKYIVHLHPDRNLLIKCSYFGLEEDRVLYEQAWLVRELV